MKGDFSRNTYDSMNHFMRVLMQQGRVQLDADWNEQVSILLHYLQNLAANLIGPHGGPSDILDTSDNIKKKNWGFDIIVVDSQIDKILELSDDEKQSLKDLLSQSNPPILIGKGHYYVQGNLCINEGYFPFSNQPHTPVDTDLSQDKNLIYIDVWERHITYIENDDIREKALGGPDTASRSELVWQVKVKKDPSIDCTNGDYEAFLDELHMKPGIGKLKAQAKVKSSLDTDPCTIPPEARYRGPENQLYRVEIHKVDATVDKIFFKWSRDNGSVVFPISSLSDNTVTLEHLDKSDQLKLKVGDWVEIVDDDYVLSGAVEDLEKVIEIDPLTMTVKLEKTPSHTYGQDPKKHPLLRRWDSKYLIEVNIPHSTFEGLEDGIEVQFISDSDTADDFRSGDYWLIPARTATRDVEWPLEDDGVTPKAVTPHGVNHYYAPLAKIAWSGGDLTVNDCRRKFKDICFITEDYKPKSP